jgi:hypothetical protein
MTSVRMISSLRWASGILAWAERGFGALTRYRSEIFKITTLLTSAVYVQESFVEQRTAAKLQGLGFKTVWDDAP